MIYRWEAPLFFANAGIFREQIRKLVPSASRRWFVLQCEAITDIDVTAADMIKGPGPRAQRPRASTWPSSSSVTGCRSGWRVYGLLDELDHEHFFAKMKPALRDVDAHDPDSDDDCRHHTDGCAWRRWTSRTTELETIRSPVVKRRCGTGRPRTTRHSPSSP